MLSDFSCYVHERSRPLKTGVFRHTHRAWLIGVRLKDYSHSRLVSKSTSDGHINRRAAAKQTAVSLDITYLRSITVRVGVELATRRIEVVMNRVLPKVWAGTSRPEWIMAMSGKWRQIVA